MKYPLVVFSAIIHWPLYIVGYSFGMVVYPLALGFINGYKMLINTTMESYLDEINSKGLEKLNNESSVDA